ncbi:Hypothetical predicted protein, partial [Pelobates cultripes]
VYDYSNYNTRHSRNLSNIILQISIVKGSAPLSGCGSCHTVQELVPVASDMAVKLQLKLCNGVTGRILERTHAT